MVQVDFVVVVVVVVVVDSCPSHAWTVSGSTPRASHNTPRWRVPDTRCRQLTRLRPIRRNAGNFMPFLI
jgi:hypothetical protein